MISSSITYSELLIFFNASPFFKSILGITREFRFIAIFKSNIGSSSSKISILTNFAAFCAVLWSLAITTAIGWPIYSTLF